MPFRTEEDATLAALAEPFPETDIEWRIGQAGVTQRGKKWAKVLAYITNRAIMERLDQVVGPSRWKNQFEKAPDGGVLCGLSIFVNGEWVTKWDGAESTDVERTKGGLSAAMKRAGVQWGIGRYLYNLPEGWAEIVEEDGQYRNKTKDNEWFEWNPPKLPEWALPKRKAK